MKSAQISGNTCKMGLKKAPLNAQYDPWADANLPLNQLHSPSVSKTLVVAEASRCPWLETCTGERGPYKKYMERSQVFVIKLFYNIVPFQSYKGRHLVVALLK